MGSSGGGAGNEALLQQAMAARGGRVPIAGQGAPREPFQQSGQDPSQMRSQLATLLNAPRGDGGQQLTALLQAGRAARGDGAFGGGGGGPPPPPFGANRFSAPARFQRGG